MLDSTNPTFLVLNAYFLFLMPLAEKFLGKKKITKI